MHQQNRFGLASARKYRILVSLDALDCIGSALLAGYRNQIEAKGIESDG
jgi:hypothetical protein